VLGYDKLIICTKGLGFMNTATHTNFQRLIAAVTPIPPTPTAVAHPCNAAALGGAVDATKAGIITPILVGPRKKILAAASDAGIDLSPYEIVDVEHSHASAETAVALVREGRAEMLMKGSLSTDELLGPVVKRDTGLRTARRLSHCFIMDVPGHANVLFITDAAINIFPTLEEKVDIVQNAIDLGIRPVMLEVAPVRLSRKWFAPWLAAARIGYEQPCRGSRP